jgi:sugar lactone lactonase YvrE
MNIETIAQYDCKTGEGPIWHAQHQRVYWTDIPTGRLFWFEPRTGEHDQCYHDRPVGGFTVQHDGQLLLFRDKGNVVTFDPQTQRVTATVVDAIPGLDETRFNDVIADPQGRVFAGTMSFGPTGTHNGRLYRFDRDGSYTLVSDGHGTPNGMGFTADHMQMYFIDSRLARIYTHDYDSATGTLTNRRVLVETPRDDHPRIGRGDGMTVDADGNLWTGRWDGSHIVVYSPDGRVRQEVPMPVKKVPSVCFGGERLDELYAVSAGGDSKDTDGELAGALFRLRPGVRGRHEHLSRVG